MQLKNSCSWQEKTKYVRSTYAHLQPYLLRCIFYCPFFDSFSIFRIFWCYSSYFWIIFLSLIWRFRVFAFQFYTCPLYILHTSRRFFSCNRMLYSLLILLSFILCSSPLCTRFLSYALLPSLLQLSYLIWIISHYLIIFLQALTAELAETTCERDRLHHKSQELKQALLVRGQVLRTIS